MPQPPVPAKTAWACLLWGCVVGAGLMLSGCHSPHRQTGHAAIRDPEYAPIEARPRCEPASHQSVAMAMMPVSNELAGEHDVDEFVRYALFQNPQVQAKRKRVEAAAQRVPQAASLKDPTIAVTAFPFYPYVLQTAQGRMQSQVVVAQEVPWFGKLDARSEAAEAEVDMARAELVGAELEVVEAVKRAYYELYFVQQAIEITERSRQLAVDLNKIADARYRTGQTSQQDLLRAELEVSRIDTELVRLNQELQSAQARLARLLHLSPDTPVRAFSELPEEQIPDDLDRLYSLAIAARPELHVQLAEVRRNKYRTDLARLDYMPDVGFSLGWGAMTTNGSLSPVSNGKDSLTIGMMANIPIYRKRLDAGVREAEANVVASAREYDNLRDMTEGEIKDLFAQATSQQEMLRLFQTEIIPKADQTLKVSISAYETNKVDFTTLIDNWQRLLQYQIMQQRLEAQLRQSLASLERVVGGSLPTSPPIVEPVPPAPETEPKEQERP